MSDTLSKEKLDELAEMRAANDDPEPEPEDDPEPEPEDDPEPEPEPASDVAMEAIGKKLDAESARHSKRVAEIMGEQMGDLVPCPLCVVPGFVTVIAPPHFDPDQRAAVLLAMGEQAEPEYKVSSTVEMCTACDGWGKVLTGSKEPNFVTKACDICGGQGWGVKQSQQQGWAPPAPSVYGGFQGSGGTITGNGVTSTGEPYPGFGISFVPVPDALPDQYKRPAGHPHYGLDPVTLSA